MHQQREVNNSFRNLCRAHSHQLNKIKIEKTKIDQMSLARVENSTAGKLLANGLKTLFRKEENKPLTKLDLQNLERRLGRYQEIKK